MDVTCHSNSLSHKLQASVKSLFLYAPNPELLQGSASTTEA